MYETLRVVPTGGQSEMQSRAFANKARGRADAGEDGVMAKAEKVWRRRGQEEVGGRKEIQGDLKGVMLMDPSAFNASICCSAEGNPFT